MQLLLRSASVCCCFKPAELLVANRRRRRKILRSDRPTIAEVHPSGDVDLVVAGCCPSPPIRRLGSVGHRARAASECEQPPPLRTAPSERQSPNEQRADAVRGLTMRECVGLSDRSPSCLHSDPASRLLVLSLSFPLSSSSPLSLSSRCRLLPLPAVGI